MATALGIRPRASIDDARPVLFYGDEPRQPMINLKPAQDAIAQKELRPVLREPGLPTNGLPGATSVDGDGLDAIGGAMRTPPFVEKRTVRERPRLSLGDVLPQRQPVEPAPTYQPKTEFSFWDRVKAALGGARYNAQGGLPGIIGGAIGGAVHPEMIDQADYATGPLAAWRRRRELAEKEEDRDLGQAYKRVQMMKVIDEINQSSNPDLAFVPGLANPTVIDKKTGEVSQIKVAGEFPTTQVERTHDLDIQKINRQHMHDLEKLTMQQKQALAIAAMNNASAKEMEEIRHKYRMQEEGLRAGHAIRLAAYNQGQTNARQKEEHTFKKENPGAGLGILEDILKGNGREDPEKNNPQGK